MSFNVRSELPPPIYQEAFQDESSTGSEVTSITLLQKCKRIFRKFSLNFHRSNRVEPLREQDRESLNLSGPEERNVNNLFNERFRFIEAFKLLSENCNYEINIDLENFFKNIDSKEDDSVLCIYLGIFRFCMQKNHTEFYGKIINGCRLKIENLLKKENGSINYLEQINDIVYFFLKKYNFNEFCKIIWDFVLCKIDPDTKKRIDKRIELEVKQYLTFNPEQACSSFDNFIAWMISLHSEEETREFYLKNLFLFYLDKNKLDFAEEIVLKILPGKYKGRNIFLQKLTLKLLEENKLQKAKELYEIIKGKEINFEKQYLIERFSCLCSLLQNGEEDWRTDLDTVTELIEKEEDELILRAYLKAFRFYTEIKNEMDRKNLNESNEVNEIEKYQSKIEFLLRKKDVNIDYSEHFIDIVNFFYKKNQNDFDEIKFIKDIRECLLDKIKDELKDLGIMQKVKYAYACCEFANKDNFCHKNNPGNLIRNILGKDYFNLTEIELAYYYTTILDKKNILESMNNKTTIKEIEKEM